MRLFDDVLTTAQYDATDLVNYPHGRVKNDTLLGAKDGTPIAEKTWGDIYNGIVELLRIAGITSSGVAEKKGASDLADAVGFLKPIAALRVGFDVADSTVKVMGGIYQDKYTAAFVEVSVYSTTTVLCKLTINKSGVACTEDLICTITPAASNEITLKAVHGIGGASPYDGYYFKNGVNDNVVFHNAAGTDIADVRVQSQAIITVYKV
jgi:hypothetical protein